MEVRREANESRRVGEALMADLEQGMQMSVEELGGQTMLMGQKIHQLERGISERIQRESGWVHEL